MELQNAPFFVMKLFNIFDLLIKKNYLHTFTHNCANLYQLKISGT
jgi:hypothetical protein